LKAQRYISNRLLASEKSSNRSLKLINSVSQFSVILGTVVILITSAILFGFKAEIINGLSQFNGHVSIQSYSALQGKEDSPLLLTESLKQIILPYGDKVNLVIYKNGLAKSNENIEGCVLKGIDHFKNLRSAIIKKGKIPKNEESDIKQVLISQKLANKLQTEVGKKVIFYFLIQNTDPSNENGEYQYKVRDLYVSGIYETGFEEIDNKTIICQKALLDRLVSDKNVADSNNISSVSEIEIFEGLEKEMDPLKLNLKLSSNEIAQGLDEKFANVYLWLSLLDNNAIIIIVLMLIIAIINMIAAVIVLIIENVQNIGLLKALGANNNQVHRIFFINIIKNITINLIIGNVIALVLISAQYYWHILPLDSSTYYVNFVPVNIHIWDVLLLNGIIFASCVLSVAIPLLMINKIKPSVILKFA
jgi:lipoprotein-releasing system permease protein